MKVKAIGGSSSPVSNKHENIVQEAIESADTHRGWLNNKEMGKIYQVLVCGYKGEKKTIDLCNTEEQMKSMTVKQLREKIAEKIPETAGLPVVYIFCF